MTLLKFTLALTFSVVFLKLGNTILITLFRAT